MKTIRHADLCSGIGGFALAAQWVGGIETVVFCEIDTWAQKILNKNFAGVPIHDDLKTLNLKNHGPIDLITCGYPCQPFSVAGKQKGEDDDRHLWPTLFGIVKAARPRWLLCENVTGHINMGLDEVLHDLESINYSTEAIVIPSGALGAPHRRDRVWIIANESANVTNSNMRGNDKCRQSGGDTGAIAEDKIKSGDGWSGENLRHTRGQSPPGGFRVDDGIPEGMDRIKGLGNAIVPQLAAEILRVMMRVDHVFTPISE